MSNTKGQKRPPGRSSRGFLTAGANATATLADKLRTLPGKLLHGALRSVRRAPRNAASAIRRELFADQEIRAVEIGPKKRNLRRIYSLAIMGVAILLVLAWLNNSKTYGAAVVIALGLGAAFVIWMGHRRLLATVFAVGGWLLSTPLLAAASASGLDAADARLRIATSNESIIGTGIAVWVCAMLIRSRQPWLTILNCWVLYVAALLSFSDFAPRYSLAGGWLVLVLYFVWRAGWLIALWDRLRGRRGLGRDYDAASEEQYQVYEELDGLPRGFVRMYQTAVSPARKQMSGVGNTRARVSERIGLVDERSEEYKAAGALDVLVCGATGLFYVSALEMPGRIAVTAGARRRITVDGAAVDSELADIARNARALSEALRVEVTSLVAMCGARFPDNTLGVLPIAITLPGQRASVSLTLIDPALLARRIPFGRPVFTTHQVQRVLHRTNMRLFVANSLDSDDRKKKRRKKVAGRKNRCCTRRTGGFHESSP